MEFRRNDKKRLSVRLPCDAQQILENYAMVNGMSLNQVIATAILNLAKNPPSAWEQDIQDLKEQIKNQGIKLNKIDKYISSSASRKNKIS